MTSTLKSELLRLLREDLEFRYAVVGLLELEEILRRMDGYEERLARIEEEIDSEFKRNEEELRRLREDLKESLGLLKRPLDALGARWGVIREGLRSRLKKELNIEVERWSALDDGGYIRLSEPGRYRFRGKGR